MWSEKSIGIEDPQKEGANKTNKKGLDILEGSVKANKKWLDLV